jgi:hypothetical protein
MFHQVDVQNLQINQTYKILANNYVFKGRFKGFRYVNEIKLVFEQRDDLSLEFDKVHNISRGLHFIRTNITYIRPVYQFVSQNPRWKMEHRSVNMFLRQLIGDEYFEW